MTPSNEELRALLWIVVAATIAVIVAIVVLARRRAVPPPVDGKRVHDPAERPRPGKRP